MLRLHGEQRFNFWGQDYGNQILRFGFNKIHFRRKELVKIKVTYYLTMTLSISKRAICAKVFLRG